MFAVRIKHLRLARELNQVQLAERLGVKKRSEEHTSELQSH